MQRDIWKDIHLCINSGRITGERNLEVIFVVFFLLFQVSLKSLQRVYIIFINRKSSKALFVLEKNNQMAKNEGEQERGEKMNSEKGRDCSSGTGSLDRSLLPGSKHLRQLKAHSAGVKLVQPWSRTFAKAAVTRPGPCVCALGQIPAFFGALLFPLERNAV